MEDLILKEREFKEKIVETINKSNLPAFILRPTLKELFDQITLLEQQQYEQALKNNRSEIKDENKTDNMEV